MADDYTPQVEAILIENGCTFVRREKRSRNVASPITRRRFMVDSFIKSRHWATYTLRQAGLPTAFYQQTAR